MTSTIDSDTEPADLSIGDLARRTGVTVATLRNWESRYGVPVAGRSNGGQRRYRESDCRMIADILERRASGVSLAAAVAQVRESAGVPVETSIYAAVRRHHPEIPVHRMDKKALLALTWAVEDQCCITARSPVLIGAFQKTSFYRSAQRRWQNMAGTGDCTIVFADFDRPSVGSSRLAEIPIADDSPLQREWALVCDSPDLPACVLGWEPPGQPSSPDSGRLFEMVWSVEPEVVRRAARIAVNIASAASPEVAATVSRRLSAAVAPASADLRRAAAVLDRALSYLVEQPAKPAGARIGAP